MCVTMVTKRCVYVCYHGNIDSVDVCVTMVT